ncbi:hypothetical protein [Methylopila sp. M107]|uniref:hypothetical protein n=1 Tax=Methylopila sp. M107 TaxID=1101190 RepID=UPI00037BD256|nr:hypothetical protein [Methylopila sp. M107]
MALATHPGQGPGEGKRRSCFLHIGPHKTGTTSIQDALFENTEKLAEIGLRYPAITGDRAGRLRRNHTPLTRRSSLKHASLMGSTYWDELSRKLETVDDSIVISSEHFAECLKIAQNYERVIEFFESRGFHVVVVAYVRDQPAWLNSWYTQDQRNFLSRDSFTQFLDRALEEGLVDPWAFLRRPIDDDRVDVRVVAFEQAVRIGITRSFLDVIGAPADLDVPEPKASNQNLGVKGVYAAQEIMRRVDGRIKSMPNYNVLYERFKRLMRGRDWEKTAYIGFTPEQEALIRARYADSNDSFARAFFGVDWATLCPPRTAALREFDFEAASEADKRDVMEVVDQMVEAIEASRADAGVVLAPIRKKHVLKADARRDVPKQRRA